MYFFGVSTLAGLKGGLLCISMVQSTDQLKVRLESFL